MKVKKIIVPLLFTIFLIAIIIYPTQTYESARNGLILWFNTIVPSLLPFFIGSSIVSSLGITESISLLMQPIMKPLFNCPGSAAYVFIMSITSGYPMGAKLTAKLVEEGKINSVEAQRILSFSNTSGPLFMMAAVSVGMLHNPKLGVLIALCHYLSAIFTGLIFRYYKKNEPGKFHIPSKGYPMLTQSLYVLYQHQLKRKEKLGELMSKSIQDSIQTMLMIGGYIILFAVIIQILQVTGMISLVSALLSPILWMLKIPNEISYAMICGFFEISTGCLSASQALVHTVFKVAMISAIIAWGGLSVHAQVLSIIQKCAINTKLYFTAKFIQAVLAFSFTYISLLFFYPDSHTVYLPIMHTVQQTWRNTLTNSLSIYIINLFLLFTIGMIIRFFYRIKITKYFITTTYMKK